MLGNAAATRLNVSCHTLWAGTAFALSLIVTRVTMSDKANAVPAHKVWQETFKRVAAAFPSIGAEHRYVGALAMELVREPERFPGIVPDHLYGDSLSHL